MQQSAGLPGHTPQHLASQYCTDSVTSYGAGTHQYGGPGMSLLKIIQNRVVE